VSLLRVDDLHVHFVARDARDRLRVAKALNGVSFAVEKGEILGLVGETGAGKSLTAMAIMGLLKPPARVTAGRAAFEGESLLDMPAEKLNALRGARMALVVQSPKTSLDPLARVGRQIERVIRAHGETDAARAASRALDLMATVGIPDPPRRARAWPHELSGGMAQRVLIAMALANDPALLMADEPTTGLDVTVQAQILDLLRRAVAERGLGAMIITHDLGVVAQYCDRVCVMFAGTIVEQGSVGRVLTAPAHPYTQALLAASPERARGPAPPAGPPPDLYDLPPGCVYARRCPHADSACEAPPVERDVAAAHRVRCHHAETVTHD
jgi:peptide/nickel transport system ATP-binding protein/oligopeptide transport system ATP-binding protein